MGTTQTKLKIDEPELDDPVCVEAEVAAGTAQPEEKEAAPAAHKKAAPAAHKSSVALTQEDRLMDMIEQASLKSPPAIANFLVQAKPWLLPMFSVLVTVLNVVGPLYIKAGVVLYDFLATLPWDLLQAFVGFGLCFFGGGYCASIAAAEAFYMTGWHTTRSQLVLIYNDAVAIAAADKKDDQTDTDGNGIADVKTIPTAELVERKLRMVAVAVKDPQRLAAAAGGMYTSWLAVQSVLRVKFARTVSVALTASQFVEYYACKALLPVLTPLTSAEFRHWLPVAIKTVVKAFFVMITWWVQEFVSAVQSGMRGGLMFSRGMCNWLNKRGITKIGPFSLEHEDTYVDEVVGYGMAACGLLFQMHFGYGMPFPLNIVMWPLDLVEWYIRWSVSSGGHMT